MNFSEIKNKINTPLLKRKAPMWVWSVARLVLLLGFSYVILYPLLVRFSVVFMDQIDLKDVTVKWIPRNFTFDNITTVISMTKYWEVLGRTFLFCGTVAIVQIAICVLSSYAFARFNFKGRGILFMIVLGTLVVPPQTYIIPLYQQFKTLGVLDTLWPFYLLGITGMGMRSGLYIYILRQAFRGMPKELEEAANVDGAGPFRTFIQVMCPNIIPTMALCLLLSFVWQWNDSFYISLFSPNVNIMPTLLSGLRTTISYYLGGWNVAVGNLYTSMLLNTAITLSLIPVIILFIVCQKFFVQGVERSGLVG